MNRHVRVILHGTDSNRFYRATMIRQCMSIAWLSTKLLLLSLRSTLF